MTYLPHYVISESTFILGNRTVEQQYVKYYAIKQHRCSKTKPKKSCFFLPNVTFLNPFFNEIPKFLKLFMY